MILIAVITGYVLGIAPFIYKEIIDRTLINKSKKEETEKQNTAEQIFNEWLNGADANKTNQVSNIYEEYMTGETKGE